jgi:threonine synthase
MHVRSLHKTVQLRCSRCGRDYPLQFRMRCETCQGLVDPVYDLETATIAPAERPFERYFDLLPFEHLASAVDLGEGNTPCRPAPALGECVGLRHLYLKDETQNPTRTTKDRMASCVLTFFRELGVREFVASSTGNSSTALAYGVQQVPEMQAHLFCGQAFAARNAYCDHPRVHLHVVQGDAVQAEAAARQFAQTQGLLFEGGFFNVARREGLKLAYLEAFDQLAPDEPDVVVQAVSSGLGLYGGYRGMREYQKLGRLHKTPRFVCAQQATCAPMVHAWTEGSPTTQPHHIIPNPSGLAEAILRGDPTQTYPVMYGLVRDTLGCFVDVSQAEMQEARQLLHDMEGIDGCYASATALAAAIALRQRGWIEPDELVMVNLTGGNRHMPAGV